MKIAAKIATGLVLGLLVGGCDKEKAAESGAPATKASAAPSAAASGAPAASSSASPAGAAPATAGGGSFKGTYKAKVGAVTPPKDAKIQLWEKDPGTAAIGDGTVQIKIDGRTVTGSAKGALGEQVIHGELDGKDFSARLDPKDPNTQDAMTGVLTGKLDGDAITGTLRVSGRNGNIVRESEIKLAKE